MSNSFITRRSSQTSKTITFDGYTDGLAPEEGKAKITLPPNVSYEFGDLSGYTTQPTEISPDYPLYGTVTVS